MKRTIVMLLVLTASALVGAADFELPPGKWWENEWLAERIDLMTDQRQQIEQLIYDHAHRMIDLNADVKRAELKLANEVSQVEFDAAAVRTVFAAFQKARQELERERFEMLVAVRGVLTSEQWLEIQEIRKEMRRRSKRPQERGVPRGRPPVERFQAPPGGPGGVGPDY